MPCRQLNTLELAITSSKGPCIDSVKKDLDNYQVGFRERGLPISAS